MKSELPQPEKHSLIYNIEGYLLVMIAIIRSVFDGSAYADPSQSTTPGKKQK